MYTVSGEPPLAFESAGLACMAGAVRAQYQDVTITDSTTGEVLCHFARQGRADPGRAGSNTPTCRPTEN